MDVTGKSETFDLFTHTNTGQDLGMVDGKAEGLDITIGSKDFTIKQSPGVLQSTRAGGTTGAVVWKICVHFAAWLGSQTNSLFEKGVLHAQSTVIELGSGISGLVPLMLGPRVCKMIATDQQYVLKLLRENINVNQPKAKTKPPSNIEVLTLDWEEDDTRGFLRSHALEHGVDALIICDCIFNYALIQPLVQVCGEICRARSSHEDGTTEARKATVCIIAQQLRQPDVLETWLRAFMETFRVWRIQGALLSEALGDSSGYVVHAGLLRDG